MNYKINVVVKKVSNFIGYPNIGDAVRHVLRDCTRPQDFNSCYVSKCLNISTRTLSRKLKQEETTFQLILDQERKKLCEELMSSGIVDAMDLAVNLGFNDVSHFYKKFPVWFGTSFLEYKNNLIQIKLVSGGCTQPEGLVVPLKAVLSRLCMQNDMNRY